MPDIAAWAHWDTPLEYQRLATLSSILERWPDVRVVSLPWARQTGKTLHARRESLAAALDTEPGGINQYSTPNYTLGTKPFRELRRVATLRHPESKLQLGNPNQTHRLISWTLGAGDDINAPVTQFKTFHPDPGDVVGETLSRLGIYDEAGRVPALGWDYAGPMHDAHDAMDLRVGSPRGKRSRYYDEYKLGLDIDGNSPLLSGKPPISDRHISLRLTAAQAHEMGLPHHKPAQLEARRSVMSPLLYRQEYESEFLDAAASPFGDLDLVHVADLEEPVADGTYVIGADLAKYQDFTSIRVMRVDCTPLREVSFARTQDMDWRSQRLMIARTSARWNHALVGIDATGVGDPVCDELEYMGVPLSRVVFSDSTKRVLIDNLIAKLGTGIVVLLKRAHDPVAYAEMLDYEVHVDTPMKGRIVTGVSVSYGHPEGFFDDTVMARALMVWAATADRSFLEIAHVW